MTSKHDESVWNDMAKSVQEFSRGVDMRQIGGRKGACISVWRDGALTLQLRRAGFSFDVIAAVPLEIAQNADLNTIAEMLYAWDVM